MLIPEWEMEEIIAARPELLECGVGNQLPKIIAQQAYLPGCGGYVDLLASSRDTLFIIELKNEYVDDVSVVTEQMAKYQQEVGACWAHHKTISSILVSTHGFAPHVAKAANAKSISTIVIPWGKLLTSTSELRSPPGRVDKAIARLLQRRLRLTDLQEASKVIEDPVRAANVQRDVESVRVFVSNGCHDTYALEQIANEMCELSGKAPIMAHQVDDQMETELRTEDEKWFWLFYSVLDRRANASTFINARLALEAHDLFFPEKIVALVSSGSYHHAIGAIGSILKASGFPLVADSRKGDEAMPSSIVDTALYLSGFGFSVSNWMQHFADMASDVKDRTRIAMKDLMAHVYGVGPRIAAQVIRGLAIKAHYEFDLSGPAHLERCPFNVFFAGPLRLGLISDESSYEMDLGRLAAEFLGGNCGIISHALWFTRKRYCSRRPRCEECPLAGYCHYFRRQLLDHSRAFVQCPQLSLLYREGDKP